ncbi:type IV toxin-antitoxin system AbiEi family antitoxin domain-containing protein [Pseudarthrobacter sulfonivorans]|uniref:type IV toxin-antitoxin system AbiEi family antitoxin domain-containing protein n=1 Tax=Pseudarthrobacter sulfonivorans TaxID=121292 RepID=UPI002103AF17|nr:type IV toxin-antitoxin system AbiEi family antitoxin domain-containing protein [Pseudarthrobacter sulfonivorans]
MDIETFLRQRAGVARTSGLRRAGLSRARIDQELTAGRIVRIRRGVYGLPREAGALGLALQHNALITCVSAAPRADSLLEVLANYHFRRAGLHVRRHVEVPKVGEVDFLLEECLVVETDGGTHLEPRQVKKDRKRNNATIVGGRLVLRFGYDDVVHYPERMVADVLEVLELCRRGAFGGR